MNEKAKCKNCTNKEEMLEEMARIIGWSYDTRSIDCGVCDDDCCEGFDNCNECKARDLYNLGYRKIPEGAVVLSKEEYSDYLMLKNDYAEIKEQNKKLQADNERLYNNLAKFKKSVEKETAKEILKLVKEKSWCYEEDENGKAWTYSITVTQLKELAKQFGVEV